MAKLLKVKVPKRKGRFDAKLLGDMTRQHGALMLAVEYGYKQCEKGNSLSRALANASAVLGKPGPIGAEHVVMEQVGDCVTVVLQRTPLVRLQLRLDQFPKRGLNLVVDALDDTNLLIRHDKEDGIILDAT
jgi:hypothetical protein